MRRPLVFSVGIFVKIPLRSFQFFYETFGVIFSNIDNYYLVN
jgi:hypothetical protein